MYDLAWFTEDKAVALAQLSITPNWYSDDCVMMVRELGEDGLPVERTE